MAGVPIAPAFGPISRAFAPSAPGTTIRVRGWVLRSRSSGGILFLVVRDRTGNLQVTAKRDVIGPESFDHAEHVQVEGAVAVTGTVHDDKRAPGGRELRATSIEVISAGEPFPIFTGQTEEFLLEKRHLAIRSQESVAIFRVKAEALRAFRRFMEEEEVLEMTPPILTGNPAEGGAEAFQFDYFGRPGYLAQTAQLYLEALITPHERVYAITPSFRAEKSRTPRHLTEYTHLEVELAWTDLEGLMAFIERMLVHVLGQLAERAAPELAQLGLKPEDLTRLTTPFAQISYTEAIDRLKRDGFSIEWGEPLGTAEERALTVASNQPLFVTRFPAHLTAFYMRQSPSDPRTVEAADLLGSDGYGEIVGASCREVDVGRLVERLKATGGHLADYEWYLDLRRHGGVPHAGFGIGIERFIRWILKREHIRDATPFPRTPSRHTP